MALDKDHWYESEEIDHTQLDQCSLTLYSLLQWLFLNPIPFPILRKFFGNNITLLKRAKISRYIFKQYKIRNIEKNI